mgnify:CR=1 FL=1
MLALHGGGPADKMAAAEPPLCQGRPDVAPHPWTDLSVSAPPDGICVWPRPGILKLCEAAKQGDMEAVRQHLDSGDLQKTLYQISGHLVWSRLTNYYLRAVEHCQWLAMDL